MRYRSFHPLRPLAAALIALVTAIPCAAQQAPQAGGWRTSFTSNVQGPDDMNSVFFLTRHEGWAVGTIAGPRETAIYRTRDGGQTWERVPLFDGAEHPGDFYKVRFADANHGWITEFYRLLRTTDGGDTWLPVDGPAGTTKYDAWGGPLTRSAILPLGANGLALGRQDGRVMFTADGGASWRVSDLPGQRHSGGGGQVAGLAFVAPSTIFAVTSPPYTMSETIGLIYRSTDGGENWEEVATSSKPFNDIKFYDAQTGVAIGDNISMWTNDGGATWTRALTPGTRRAVAFIDAQTVVSVGSDPHVLISRNGGKSWTGMMSPGTRESMDLNDIAVVDGGWWFAAGDHEPRVFHYNDPGYVAEIAEATIPFPRAVRGSGGVVLPPGAYRVAIGHRGHNHSLGLRLVTPAQGVTIGVRGKPRLGPNEYACSPCETTLPVDAEYSIEDASADAGEAESAVADGPGAEAGTVDVSAGATASGLARARSRFRLSLEPTETGVALVLDATIAPPRDVGLALAAFNAPTNADVNARTAAATTTRRSGGLLGAARRAASGDVRGALADAGANPRAATEAVRAGRDRASAARSSPPALYHVKVRYPFELIGAAGTPNNN